jgi:hypothetical protein
MKIRKGFVSNSSSSSFVVAFAKKPESIDELKLMMFGDEELFPNPYEVINYTTTEIASTVWKDMTEEATDLREVFNRGFLDGDPDYPDFWDKKISPENEDKRRNKYYKMCDKHRLKRMKEFLNQTSGSTYYVFSYSDNDGGYYSTLEHGEIFYNLLHVRFNEH